MTTLKCAMADSNQYLQSAPARVTRYLTHILINV